MFHKQNKTWALYVCIWAFYVMTYSCTSRERSAYITSSVESQKGVIAAQRCFRWEPEGRYCCTKSMAIAPFWFSTEHCWSAITALLALNWRHLWIYHSSDFLTNRQLRDRRALTLIKDVPLRTRMVLSLYKVDGDSALLVLNGTSFNLSRHGLLGRRLLTH